MLLRLGCSLRLTTQGLPLLSAAGLSWSAAPSSGQRHVLHARPKDVPHSLTELVALNNLRDLPGSRKVARRVGRGQGSSKGKTCGRGMKGQGQRSKKPRPGFEGGQTPLYKRVKKSGFTNEVYGRALRTINLSQIQALVDRGLIDPSKPVTMKTLYDAGLFSRVPEHGIKLCSAGALWFQAKLDLYITSASETARAVIEASGGRVTTVYYNPSGIRAFLKGEGSPFPGQPLPVFAHAAPHLASRFVLPRAPESYPKTAFSAIDTFVVTYPHDPHRRIQQDD